MKKKNDQLDIFRTEIIPNPDVFQSAPAQPEVNDYSPVGTMKTSINMPLDIHEWVEREAEARGQKKSQIILRALRERMETRPSGFRNDVEWIMDNRILFYNEEVGENIFRWTHYEDSDIAGFDAAYSLSLLDEPAFSYLLIAEDTRDNLRKLFADAVMFNLEVDTPTIMLIPYRFDPHNKTWESLKRHKEISICTPEGLADVAGEILRRTIQANPDWDKDRVGER
jgi:hypothetical protein